MPKKEMTAEDYDILPWMHIYAQYIWHSEAKIIGTKEALIGLRNAIDKALADKNGEAEAKAFAADGEGYGIIIRKIPRVAVQNARLPYMAYVLRELEPDEGFY